MKKAPALLLALCLALSLTGCEGFSFGYSGFAEDGDFLTLTRGGITVTVDPASGMVKSVAGGGDSIQMDGILIDPGIDGEQLFHQIGYKDMSGLATYELPVLYPRMKELPEYTVEEIAATADGFTVVLSLGVYTITYEYGVLEDGLSLTALLETSGEQTTVNGVGFLVRGIEGYTLENASYEFPGSTPAGKISYSSATRYRATSADYSAPAVVLTDGEKTSCVLFVDEVEKWTAGSYFDSDGKPCVAFLAAAEGCLSQDEPMEVGTLYLPLGGDGEDVYASISAFWTELGYHTPDDTTATDDLVAIYSGHPFGTMDTDYFNHWTLDEYAERIDSVADMGVDAIWLLPIFQHTGDNVYEPIDQGVIDSRYGGLEAAEVFCDRAHELGLSVLFDFVPHGPRPEYEFAVEHDDWISKTITGENQLEWECVSFDYNNPDYYDYNVSLAEYYAETLGLDGARVDCAMGGLPNWSSATGLRASASGLGAGLSVLKALREGFQSGGSSALILPENFHPSPAYASVTDVFYDMPLYRCLYDLNQLELSETEYVSRLTEYLTAEHGTSVAGQLKLRFLGNHDTVTWTYDAARAQTVYGTERAKGLWEAIGWIDGVLYLYQGDEDPETYGLEGENLESFFTELISIKREYLPNTLDTAYLETGTPIFAFYRYDDEVTRLVLVNLSDEAQSFSLDSGDTVLSAMGGYELEDGELTLEAYTGVVLDSSME